MWVVFFYVRWLVNCIRTFDERALVARFRWDFIAHLCGCESVSSVAIFFVYIFHAHLCVCTLFIAVCGTPNACGALSAHDSVCGKIRCKFQVP